MSQFDVVTAWTGIGAKWRRRVCAVAKLVSRMIGDKITICGPEVLFETCVAMKFVDDDNDDDSAVSVAVRQNTNRRTLPLTVVQNTCT